MLCTVLIALSALLPVASAQYLCVTCLSPQPTTQVQWAQWGEWGPCMQQAGVTAQTRVRLCDALQCDQGQAQEARSCSLQLNPQPPPTWSDWGQWSQCSASCGGGVQQRTRTCPQNPCSSCTCPGAATEQQQCNQSPCCSWTAWSPWSECSATCGSGGYKSRTRQCSCLTGCQGATSEQQTCAATVACPSVTQPPPQCPTCTPVIVNPQPCTTCYNPCLTCGYISYKKRMAEVANFLRQKREVNVAPFEMPPLN